MFTIIMYAILIIAAIGAIVGWQNAKKGATWGQPLTIVCAIIAIGIGFYLGYAYSFGNADLEAGISRENAYQRAQGIKMARLINEKYAGKKIIIVTDPFMQEEPENLKALKKELSKDIEIVAELQPEPSAAAKKAHEQPDMDMGEPMENWYKAKSFDKMIGKNKADLIITTIGIPADTKMNGKKITNCKALDKIDTCVLGGSIYEYAMFIKNGKIVAAISYNPKAEYDNKPAPRDIDEAFNKRFLLITPENVLDIFKNYDGVFKKNK